MARISWGVRKLNSTLVTSEATGLVTFMADKARGGELRLELEVASKFNQRLRDRSSKHVGRGFTKSFATPRPSPPALAVCRRGLAYVRPSSQPASRSDSTSTSHLDCPLSAQADPLPPTPPANRYPPPYHVAVFSHPPLPAMDSRKRPLEDGSTSPAKRPKGPDPERIQKMLAEARAKAGALAAKLQANKAGQSPSPSPAAPQSAAERLAAMRSRVANAVSRSTASAAPARPISSAPTPAFRRDDPDSEEAGKARGGLDVGLHPALLGDSMETASRRGKMQPKFATTMANRRADSGRGGKGKKQLDLSAPSIDLVDPSKNPYYDPNIAAKSLQPRRIPKTLHFNQKGKYIEQANALRRQEALEEMKKRIAAAARKVGIDEDMHADKAFAVSSPSFTFLYQGRFMPICKPISLLGLRFWLLIRCQGFAGTVCLPLEYTC